MEKIDLPYWMPRSEQKIRTILLRLAEGGYVCGEYFSIGPVESLLVRDAELRGIIVAKGHLYFSDTQVQHALRDAKRMAGIAVSCEELATFPQRLRRMELWFDNGHLDYIYLDRKSKSKYIIDTNRRIKT